MLQINTEDHSWLGKRGATSQRWEYDLICKTWRRLAKQFKKLNAIQRSRKLEALAADDRELNRAIFEYVAKNFEDRLRELEGDDEPSPRPKPKPKATPEELAEAKQEREQEISNMTKSIEQQITLLNLEMPNGKRMRYCTGTEMLGFGKHYQAIGKKCGNKMVGQVLNEDEVRKLKR